MKTKKLINIMLVVMASIAIFSCVENDDYDIPEINIEEPVINGTIIDVNEVKNAYLQAQNDGENFLTFQETNNYVSGYVVSSDEAGNFFKELFIQNTPENPTAGVKILINVASLFGTYEIGRKVYVKLDGLSVGIDSGVITIGTIVNNEIDRIPAPLEGDFIKRSSEVASIVPQSLTLSELTENHVGTLINLPKAQITQEQLSLSYANEVGEEFDGERILESCSDDGGSIILSTSSFADFKTSTVPSDAGSITAVLAKDFFGEQNVLLIRDTEDLDFQEARCEPQFLDPGIESNSTFQVVKSRYEQEDGYEEIGLDENDLIIEGYVVGNDESGKFYKELLIQNTALDVDNSPTDPRLGLRITLNRQDLYQNFQIGRKVYVKLNGLAIDMENGVLTIGYPNVSEIQEIPDGVIDSVIIPGSEIEELIPLTKDISDFNENDISTFVKIEDVQIVLSESNLTYAGEAFDDFDGSRTLLSCETGQEIELQTSTFANFKSQLVNPNRGSIQGVLSRDYYDDFNVLIINNTDDVLFDNEQRCDPVFEETFANVTDDTNLDIDNWLNYAEIGSELWTEQVYSGNGYAEFNAYATGESTNIGWLISPGIDMDAQSGEILTFQTEYAYPDAGHYPLEVYVSSDFDGTEAGILTATWEDITNDVEIAHPDNTPDWFTWVDSGPIDLSGYTGTLYVAFKYTGSDTANQNSTIHVDNVIINVL